MDLKESVKESEVFAKAKVRLEQLEQLGVGDQIVSRRESIPEFPEDVTALDSASVMKYLTIYEGEVAYIKTVIATLDIKIKHAQHIIKTYKRKRFVELRRAKVSVPDATAAVDCDKEVVDAELETLQLEAMREILVTRLDTYAKFASLMSKELTRRKNETFVNMDIPVMQAQNSRIDLVKGKKVSDFRSKNINSKEE